MLHRKANNTLHLPTRFAQKLDFATAAAASERLGLVADETKARTAMTCVSACIQGFVFERQTQALWSWIGT